MEKVYAHALTSALDKGRDEKSLVDGLVKHLKSVGRIKLLPGILRELKLKQERASASEATLEVASADEKAGAVKEAHAAGINPKHVLVNDSLIRGWRARAGGTLVDRSGKKALVELYRNITT